MTTALEIPGAKVAQTLGVCYGLVVRSMGFVGGVAAVMGDLPPLDDPLAAPPTRWRRGGGHGQAAKAAPDWRPTAERFRDPGTNRVMRVWVDAAGGRHYVADDGG